MAGAKKERPHRKGRSKAIQLKTGICRGVYLYATIDSVTIAAIFDGRYFPLIPGCRQCDPPERGVSGKTLNNVLSIY